MFADACDKMTKCTRPLIVSTVNHANEVSSGIGSFVVINQEGWILTAAHMIHPFRQWQMDQSKIAKVDEYNSTHEGKKEYDPHWLKAQSFWWSFDKVIQEQMYVNGELDLAVVKLKNFNPDSVKEYPVFKDPSKIRVGMSLCRIGFPFVKAATTYDPDTKMFTINKGVLPVPFFPNEGIFTRIIQGGKSNDGGYDIQFVETSSPGLRGQSGGPIFDKNGYIVGIQSRTAHLDLGFNTENNMPQYMNIGMGVHVKSILQVLDKMGVKYKSESDDEGYRIIS